MLHNCKMGIKSLNYNASKKIRKRTN